MGSIIVTQLTSSSLLSLLAIISLSPAVLCFWGSDKLKVKLGSSATGTFYYIIYFLIYFSVTLSKLSPNLSCTLLFPFWSFFHQVTRHQMLVDTVFRNVLNSCWALWISALISSENRVLSLWLNMLSLGKLHWLRRYPGNKVNPGSPYTLCNYIYFSSDAAVLIALAQLLLATQQHYS